MYVDRTGKEADAAILSSLASSMWWLCFVDGPLPVGEIVYVGVIVVAILVTIDFGPEILSSISYEEATPSEDIDDDFDDDYYDDDDNFGGKKTVGRNKGDAPRNNQKQNMQARDALRSRLNREEQLNRDQQEKFHRWITDEGLSYQELQREARLFRTK